MKGDYANGKIYKIYSYQGTDEETYYGSTTQILHKRFANHRKGYKCWKKNEKYIFTTSFSIFEKYGIEACHIELVELFPCETKEQLIAKEGFYIRNNPCVNKRIEGRTALEYRQDNAEHIKQYYQDNKEHFKQFYQDNKEQIAKHKKQYYQANKEQIAKHTKQYRENNADQIKENKKKYYETNKNEINKKQRENRLLQKQQSTLVIT